MTKRLRLLKVIVQPVYVEDDGDELVERTANPVTVSAEDWPTFAQVLEEQRLAAEASLISTPGNSTVTHPTS